MERVYTRPRFRKLDDEDYKTFWCSLRDARKTNKHGDFVLLRDAELYRGAQKFLIGNGIAGFAIYDDELISVHKNNKKAAETAVQHILPKMVRCGFKYGAKFGDCYGEWLANYYMRSGFIVVAKIAFDKLPDNPVDWKFDTFGKPDIYIMIRGVKNVAELDRLKKNNEIQGFEAVEGKIPTLETLEEAMEYRAKMYDAVKKYGYKKRLEIIQNLYKK
jgi:hypothetical protein